VDGVRSGSFSVADCAIVVVVLQEILFVVMRYVYLIVNSVMKLHVFERSNNTLNERKSI
jgi:hypothetical protein